MAYTVKQIQEALELYKNKEHTVQEIESITGVARSSISEYARREGIPLRQPKKNRNKICQYCHRTVNLPGIRFCPFCGKDIRTNEEILLFDIDRLHTYTKMLPENEREKYRSIIIRIKTYFNERKSKNDRIS